LRGKYNLDKIFVQKGFQNIKLSQITVAERRTLAYKNPQSSINLAAIVELSRNFDVLTIDENTWD
jgi:hydroxyacyl-ACP dehydratase HTD2-like protein with hotdog domain